MICPVCGKEITRPLHITKSKDDKHQLFVKSQIELSVKLLHEGIPPVDIKNDERIILETLVIDYLFKHHNELLKEIRSKVKKERISQSMSKEDSGRNAWRNKLNDLITNGKEGIDFVICKICGLKSTNLSTHVPRIHGISCKDYKEQYNSNVFTENFINKNRKRMLSNNPNDNPEAIAKMIETKAGTKDERSRKAKEQFASGERTPSYNAGRGVGGFRPDLGHYCRSMWEANVARILQLKGIEYEFEKEAIPFYDENGDLIDSYLPDFYLPKSETYLEVKGQMDDVSKKKLDLLKEHHPEVKVFLIDDIVYSKMINSFKNKLDKRLEYSKRNIKTHPHLFEGGFK